MFLIPVLILIFAGVNFSVSYYLLKPEDSDNYESTNTLDIINIF